MSHNTSADRELPKQFITIPSGGNIRTVTPVNRFSVIGSYYLAKLLHWILHPLIIPNTFQKLTMFDICECTICSMSVADSDEGFLESPKAYLHDMD